MTRHPMAVSRRALSLALASLAPIAACRGPDPGNSRAELRAALDAAYPEGWRFASLDPDARSKLEAGERAEWIGGDFDGDGRSDDAAQLVIWKLGHTTDAYLARIPRGERVAEAEGGAALALERDAVHQIFAGKASVAHLHEDGHWRTILTGD